MDNQNEKVSQEAAGLPVKSPAEQTADMSSRPSGINQEPVVRQVEARSQDNIDIARTAREWIRWALEVQLFMKIFGCYNIPDVFSSEEAQSHLKGIMQGVINSRRHQLFFDKKEREGSGARSYSRLYQMANTNFLGEDDLLDDRVMKQLQEIYHKHIGEVGS